MFSFSATSESARKQKLFQDTIWDQLKSIYTQKFQYLVFGELPKEQDIHESLSKIKIRLDKIDRDIKADEET